MVFGQRTQLWWDLAVVESFRLLQRSTRSPRPTTRAQMKVFDELLDVGELLDQPVRKLSLGQRMRCDLAAALLHDPRSSSSTSRPSASTWWPRRTSARSCARRGSGSARPSSSPRTTSTTSRSSAGASSSSTAARCSTTGSWRTSSSGSATACSCTWTCASRRRAPTWPPAPVGCPCAGRAGERGLQHVAEFSRLEVTSAEVIQCVVRTPSACATCTSREPDIEEVVRADLPRRRILAVSGRSGPASRAARRRAVAEGRSPTRDLPRRHGEPRSASPGAARSGGTWASTSASSGWLS